MKVLTDTWAGEKWGSREGSTGSACRLGARSAKRPQRLGVKQKWEFRVGGVQEGTEKSQTPPSMPRAFGEQ